MGWCQFHVISVGTSLDYDDEIITDFCCINLHYDKQGVLIICKLTVDSQTQDKNSKIATEENK